MPKSPEERPSPENADTGIEAAERYAWEAETQLNLLSRSLYEMPDMGEYRDEATA